MTDPADIRALAEAELEQLPRATLAKFSLAVLDALDDPESTRCGVCGIKADLSRLRAAIARNLSKERP